MFRKIVICWALASAASVLAPAAVLAHPGMAPAAGLAAGFAHPLTGIDHVLAMIAVGMFAANLGGRALWALPLAFLTLMGFGGALGMAGVTLPYVETMIALSVVIIGLAVAIPQCPLLVAMPLVGIFAVFHGHAHGTEMADTMSAARFGLGFLVATGTLHVLGIGLALAIARLPPLRARQASRVAGLTTAVVGLGLLAMLA